jgi:hypothetical protein
MSAATSSNEEHQPSCSTAKEAMIKRSCHVLFDFYIPLRVSIHALHNVKIIRIADDKDDTESFITFNEFVHESYATFPLQKTLEMETMLLLIQIFTFISHYNFTLPLIELRELVEKLHSTDPDLTK